MTAPEGESRPSTGSRNGHLFLPRDEAHRVRGEGDASRDVTEVLIRLSPDRGPQGSHGFFPEPGAVPRATAEIPHCARWAITEAPSADTGSHPPRGGATPAHAGESPVSGSSRRCGSSVFVS